MASASKRRQSFQPPEAFDPVTQIPTSATQFPPPKQLTDSYNKHLFQYPEIFRQYIQLHAGNCSMYSDAQSSRVETAFVCTLNNTNWKKPNKKMDLLSAQRLILKHLTIFHLLLPTYKSILNRLNQVTEYFETHINEFQRDIELRFVESEKSKNFSRLCDTPNRRTCSPICQDTTFKELYHVFEKYNRDLGEMDSSYDAYHRTMYDDIQTSYEYVIGLKASISACHGEILCLQTIGLGEQIAKKGTKFGLGREENTLTTKSDKKLTTSGSSRDLHNDSSIHMAKAKEVVPAEVSDRRGSTLPTAFDFYFSPDIICLLWQQEYECQYQAELTRRSVNELDRFISRQKIKNTVAVAGIPVDKIERGPYHLSRYTHFGAGLEISNRYLPDAQQNQQTFSIYSLVLTGDELRGILSIPPPHHIIDRRKLGSILDMDGAKEYVNNTWVKQCYQQQYVCYTPRPGLPTRVELSFLPRPPQKLYNLELTSLNYSLSGTPHLDTFIRYLSVEGGDLEMYSECRMDKLKDIYMCELHHFKTKILGLGKNKIDVKQDLYSVQKLILKHAIITQRLFSLLLDMVARLRTVMNDFEHSPVVQDWLETEQEMILKTQSHAIVYGTMVDYPSTLALLSVPFQEMFNCYHRYTYNQAWLLLETKQSASRSTTVAASLNETLKAKGIYQSLFSKHLPLSYELIFRLKILLYTVYDRIVIVQSLSNPRWMNEIKKAHLAKDISPDILCCLWFQKHYKPLSSLDDTDHLDVQRKLLFRTPNCFVTAVDLHHEKPFVIESLTLSDDENRLLFRPPASDAVIDVEEVLKLARSGFDGRTIPDWVYLSYCNRFSQYCYRPQIPTIRLPILPADVIDISDHGNKKSAKTPPQTSPSMIFSRLFSRGGSRTPNTQTHKLATDGANSDTALTKKSKGDDDTEAAIAVDTAATTTTLDLPGLETPTSGEGRPPLSEDGSSDFNVSDPPSPLSQRSNPHSTSASPQSHPHNLSNKSSPQQRSSFRDSFLFRWTRKGDKDKSLNDGGSVDQSPVFTYQEQGDDVDGDNDQPYIAPMNQTRSPVGADGKPLNSSTAKNDKSTITMVGSSPSSPNPTDRTRPSRNDDINASPSSPSRTLHPISPTEISRASSASQSKLSSVPARGLPPSKQVVVDADDHFFDDSVLISFQHPETP